MEADNTIKGQAITKLLAQFKDSEERNRGLRRINYDMSCAAATRKGHLLGESAAQVIAPARLPPERGKVNGDKSLRTCADILTRQHAV